MFFRLSAEMIDPPPRRETSSTSTRRICRIHSGPAWRQTYREFNKYTAKTLICPPSLELAEICADLSQRACDGDVHRDTARSRLVS